MRFEMGQRVHVRLGKGPIVPAVFYGRFHSQKPDAQPLVAVKVGAEIYVCGRKTEMVSGRGYQFKGLPAIRNIPVVARLVCITGLPHRMAEEQQGATHDV